VKQISHENAGAAFQKILTLSEEEAVRSLERFTRDHPAIMAFLGDRSSRDGVTREESTVWFALAMGIEEAIRSAGFRCKGITIDELETAEEQNTSWAEEEVPGTPDDTAAEPGATSAGDPRLAGYPQTPLLTCAMERLEELEPSAVEPDETGVAPGLVVLKTLIDCLVHRALPAGRGGPHHQGAK